MLKTQKTQFVLLSLLSAVIDARADSYIMVMPIDSGIPKVVFATPEALMAPNWMPDGKSLLLNSDTKLWRHPLGTSKIETIDTGSLSGMSNDHILSPDGKW